MSWRALLLLVPKDWQSSSPWGRFSKQSPFPPKNTKPTAERDKGEPQGMAGMVPIARCTKGSTPSNLSLSRKAGRAGAPSMPALSSPSSSQAAGQQSTLMLQAQLSSLHSQPERTAGTQQHQAAPPGSEEALDASICDHTPPSKD